MASILNSSSTDFQSNYIKQKRQICSSSCPLLTKQPNLIIDCSYICIVSKLNPLPQPAPCSQFLPCTPCQNNDPFFISVDKPFYLNNFINPLAPKIYLSNIITNKKQEY
jgi:hypothetical protein